MERITIRMMNEYRNAGAAKRRSPRMQQIRERIDGMIKEILADRNIPDRRAHLLHKRFVLRMSVQQVCMSLYISERTYFREMRKIKAQIERQ
ncbi:MAG: hypothetical protein IJP98_02335 [Clostridia bacterium]|nr:hypothetical protein [Clostridia bacterium]